MGISAWNISHLKCALYHGICPIPFTNSLRLFSEPGFELVAPLSRPSYFEGRYKNSVDRPSYIDCDKFTTDVALLRHFFSLGTSSAESVFEKSKLEKR